MHFTEIKTEVSIDRLTSQANPRNFERVPAGAKFGLNLVLNVHKDDDQDANLQLLFDGLELVAADYLGGQGTRGYGAVRITVSSVEKLDIANLKGSTDREKVWSAATVKGVTLPWIRPKE